MKKLIISCDDLGITKEINLAIKDCSEKGVISSSSIVVNGQFYEHALNNIIDKVPMKFFGLHLNLTEGKAINKNSANVISDANNVFKIKAGNYFFSNFYKQDKDLKIAVYNEFKSQIKKALNDGIKISHFDSHEHIHHSPWIFKIVTELGNEFKINKIRFVNEKILLKNYFKDIFYKLKSLNYIKHIIINICNRKITNTFLSTDYFFGILNSGKIKMDELFLYLDNIDLNQSIEVCIHPSNEILDNTSNSDNSKQRDFYASKNRKNEKILLMSEELKYYLNNQKIDLINFSNIV